MLIYIHDYTCEQYGPGYIYKVMDPRPDGLCDGVHDKESEVHRIIAQKFKHIWASPYIKFNTQITTHQNLMQQHITN